MFERAALREPQRSAVVLAVLADRGPDGAGKCHGRPARDVAAAADGDGGAPDRHSPRPDAGGGAARAPASTKRPSPQVANAFQPKPGEPAVPEGRRLKLLMADLDGSGHGLTLARLSVYNDETLETTIAITDSRRLCPRRRQRRGGRRKARSTTKTMTTTKAGCGFTIRSTRPR